MKGTIDPTEAMGVALGGTFRRVITFFVLCVAGDGLALAALNVDSLGDLSEFIVHFLWLPMHWLFIVLYGVSKIWGIAWLVVLGGALMHLMFQELPTRRFLVGLLLGQMWVTFVLGIQQSFHDGSWPGTAFLVVVTALACGWVVRRNRQEEGEG